jgi:hypothetical protein
MTADGRVVRAMVLSGGSEDLGGALGLLNFDRGHVIDLIAKGYADAVAHDCLASGCILPVAEVGPEGSRPTVFAPPGPKAADSPKGAADA